ADATLHAFDQLIRRGIPAASLPDLLRSTLDASGNLRHVRRLQRQADALRLRAALPSWLSQASAVEQYGYLQALAGNLLQSPSQQDYLFDLPSIPDYARGRVRHAWTRTLRPVATPPTNCSSLPPAGSPRCRRPARCPPATAPQACAIGRP
ncbi:hypothetical protein G3436_05480, partial [Pseudomonas sp. MAFF212427]